MENIDIMVDFKKYCETCKYKDGGEFDGPCHECLSNPINTQTDRPVKYEKKEVKTNENKEIISNN